MGPAKGTHQMLNETPLAQSVSPTTLQPASRLQTAVERVQWLQHVESASRGRSWYEDSGKDYSRCGGNPHYWEDQDYRQRRDSDSADHRSRSIWSRDGRVSSTNFREQRPQDYSPAVRAVGRGVESPLETLMKTNLAQEVKGLGNRMESESKAPVNMDGCLQVIDSKVQTLERARRGSLSQSPHRRSPPHVEGSLPVPKPASLSSNHGVPGIMVGDEDDRCRPKIKGQVCIFSRKVLGSKENMPGSRVDSANVFRGLENDDGRCRPKLERDWWV
ncbi:hypothetical protein EGW08_023787 [Elysia chlorotica]|uniref:Uncharacterized protein n=1 Tax=Elysia chlorotica TaxID=188477 RepID=A0A433SI55_ELYCH|nr:hypothetical protein EGW08_023787 [Elysia chlorotica]